MLPRKSVIETIPAIKTHISQNNIEGPGYWKMNCSLLDDNNNQREPRFTAKMPVCPAEGRCDLSGHRCIWDWIKYNFRAHAVQFSKRKAKEKKGKENNVLQDKFNNAKKTFECDPTNKNASDFKTAKEKLEHFYKENLQGIIIRAWVRWCGHGELKEYEIFSQSGEKTPTKSAKIELINGSITTDPFN